MLKFRTNENAVNYFLNSKLRNEWLRIGPMEVYVRKSNRMFEPNVFSKTFDVANVDVQEAFRQKGHFKNFMKELEKILAETDFEFIFVENVMNPILEEFLPKIGFESVGFVRDPLPSFVKKISA